MSDSRDIRDIIAHELMLMRTNIQFIPDPTYAFHIDESVHVGNLKNSIIKEVIQDGKLYLVESDSLSKNNTDKTYQVFPWYQLRPTTNKATAFANPPDIKPIYMHRTIESLLHDFYAFGVNMTPAYQRDYVWSDNDREKLIESIFMGIDIGRITFIEPENRGIDKPLYDILDGKQRLNTLTMFYENRLPYRGYLYNDLSGKDKHHFLEHPIDIGTIRTTTSDTSTIIEQFIRLNRAGHKMSDADIEHAINLLHNSQND